jgi:hypothetical protein
MTVKKLYRYEREEGKVTVSTENPEGEYVLRYRLIAEKNKLLTNDGETFTTCIDVESTEGWDEVNGIIADTTKVYG